MYFILHVIYNIYFLNVLSISHAYISVYKYTNACIFYIHYTKIGILYATLEILIIFRMYINSVDALI